MLLLANGLREEAHRWVCARPLPPAGETFLLTAMAEAALAAQDHVRANQLASAAVAADFYNVTALMVQSHACLGLRNYHEALGHAQNAHRVDLHAVPVVLQIMRCQNQLGDHYAAIAAHDGLGPDVVPPPDMHIELGTASAGLDRVLEAAAAFRAALAAVPPPMDAPRSLLKLHVNAADDVAVETLHKQYAADLDADIDCVLLRGLHRLRCGEVAAARHPLLRCHNMNIERGDALQQLPWPVPEPRLRHDYEQLELLRRRGKLSASGQAALAVLEPYQRECGDP